jgi:predicted RNase H-like nuclease (RuvC/YqgF family)
MNRLRDVLDTPGGPVHSEPPPNPRRKITCEFCECELGQSGEYKSLSDTAKKYRALKDTNEKLEAELTKVRQDCESLRHEIEALKPKVKERTQGGLAL